MGAAPTEVMVMAVDTRTRGSVQVPIELPPPPESKARAPVAAPRPPTLPPPPPPAPAARRRALPVVVAIVAVVALIAVGVVAWVVTRAPEVNPSVPSPVGLQAVETSATSITIAWAAEGRADAFVVARDGVEVGRVPGGTFTYTDAGLLPETSYRYTVASEVGGEVSAPSAVLAAETTPASPSAAALDGLWDVRMVLRSVHGYPGYSAGDRSTFQWLFRPRGDGAVVVADATSVAGQPFTVKLDRRGATYSGTERAQLSNCMGTPVTDTVDVTVKVTAGSAVGGAWSAVRLKGTMEDYSPTSTYPGGYCPASGYVAELSGRLSA